MIKLRKTNLANFKDIYSSDDEEKNLEDSSDSQQSDWEKKHSIESIYDPVILRNKLIISVEDTGIGIKKKD